MVKKKIGLIVGIIALILCGLGFWFITKSTSYTLTQDYTLYHDGKEYNLEKNSSLIINKNETISFEYAKDFEIDTDDIPLYANDRKSLLLTSKYVYCRIDLANGYMRGRINCLTTVTDNGDYTTITSNNHSANETAGILYDGDSTYVLIRPMTLIIDDSTVSLDRLSFVYVDKYHNTVYYYDHNKNYYTHDDFNSLVTLDGGDYIVDLCRDTIALGSKEYFMPSITDSMEDYFKGGN